MPMPGPPSPLFTIVPIFIAIIFAAAIATLVFFALKGLREWLHNNRQPVYAEPARAVAKRTHVWGSGMHHGPGRTVTKYYVTFEFEDGQRQEFSVSGQVYGQVAQGDSGTLTYQGTRFHNFQRS